MGCEPVRGAGRRRDQPEQQERSDRLGGFGGHPPERQQEQHTEHHDRHATRARRAGIETREQQGPGDDQHEHADADCDECRELSMHRVKPENRTEQGVGCACATAAGTAGRKESECQYAQPQDPGDGDADRQIVDVGPTAEGRKQHGTGDGEHEEPQACVQTKRKSNNCAGKGEMTQGVCSEYLHPEHRKPADKAAGDSDERAGQQGVLQNGVCDHAGWMRSRRRLRDVPASATT